MPPQLATCAAPQLTQHLREVVLQRASHPTGRCNAIAKGDITSHVRGAIARTGLDGSELIPFPIGKLVLTKGKVEGLSAHRMVLARGALLDVNDTSHQYTFTSWPLVPVKQPSEDIILIYPK